MMPTNKTKRQKHQFQIVNMNNQALTPTNA